MHHRLYWQAKIWGLLHDPAFKPLLEYKQGEGLWENLAVMKDIKHNSNFRRYIKKADFITSASDRAAIGNINDIPVNYGANGLKIAHLLSGKPQDWSISDRDELINRESELFPDWLTTENNDPQKVFWWLWRCLPTAVCRASTDENRTSLLLMPAETRIPDTSLWSHSSMTAALAGAMVGYHTTIESFNDVPERDLWYKYHSHPYLVSFSFAPVQDLIKSSRKMRDFWAGSWILHYLSAQVSWELARLYGADSLLYPSLFHQPLIDRRLLERYPDFEQWIKEPSVESLLTAGFPNVIVMVLPENEVEPAMQTAKQYLKKTWKSLGEQVFNKLADRDWMPGLSIDANSWNGWLDTQWQIYWTGLPIGKKDKSFQQSSSSDKKTFFDDWVGEQNKTYNLNTPSPASTVDDNNQQKNLGLFQPAELNLLENNTNIGSWWGYIFDVNRLSLASIKNARNWEIPIVFSTRSTVSGLGAAVHNKSVDWAKEGEVKTLWQQNAGLFNGSEQLNATEVVKRGLHKILPELLNLDANSISIAYPDLCSGVAGYLKTKPEAVEHYISACEGVRASIKLDGDRTDDYKWGIPWAEKYNNLQQCHPRLLNAGWLVEDLTGIDTDEQRITERNNLKIKIDSYYPNNNPTDWYVLASGDGDGMSEWLKGIELDPYAEYVAAEINNSPNNNIQEFLKVRKRMGPSTHNALSRALLDFSNQLVPYLTETRYAGRLIYGGGDDVLAYTNLWEWDSWLWDIRQCFKGREDPQDEFKNDGDYWQWQNGERPKNITPRPLFTMGSKATISFGIVIAHQSVPMAIALENLWAAEESAKEHQYQGEENGNLVTKVKDAVQVRVMYQNGNIASSTAKFDVFNSWRTLLDKAEKSDLDAAIFEQAATVWAQHPAPTKEAIEPWCRAFCSRREALNNDTIRLDFQNVLRKFISDIIDRTQAQDRDEEISNWLKLAAFILRRREIVMKSGA
jgi:CRISPR-associated protein Cmr2